jgi:hypothetical protein
VRDDRVERPLRGERADVQLVDDVGVERKPVPVPVGPRERRVDHLGRLVDGGRLAAAGRGRPLGAAVEAVQVAGARRDAVEGGLEVPVLEPGHRDQAVLGGGQVEIDPLPLRRPDAEPAAAVGEVTRPEPRLPEADPGGRPHGLQGHRRV